MTQVFISYSHKDLAFVDHLAKDLQEAGVEAWYDLAGLEAGTRWGRELQDAIRKSRCFLVVLSPESVASEWVEKEFLFASSNRLKIIPLLHRACRLPLWFINLQCIDLQKKNYDKHFEQLLQALGRPGGEKDGQSVPAPAVSKPASKKPRHNLPVQLTSFIGREREVEEVEKLLESRRLVTLTGAGGTGKTRLALQVAAGLLNLYPGGTWFVELAPITNPDLIAQTVLSAADMQVQQGRSTLESLLDFLREKTCLVILDNCEHLVEACAVLVETLLRACPRLKILATSREALRVPGEAPHRVPSLAVPDLRRKISIQELLQYESVRLFVERAATALPAFAATEGNAPALAQVCHQLDGIPLAIELAAARIPMLSLEQIAARLDDCFRLLTGGSRTALPRHQTLRALIDWSYNLLSPEERTLLQRLSVFAGGWSLAAAEAVCGGAENLDVLDLLARLINKSLVSVESGPAQEARYRLLETIRQYADDKLEEKGDRQRLRDHHLVYHLNLAEEAEPHLLRSEQVEWLASLEQDHDNLRAALEWASGRTGADPPVPPEAGLRIASALWRFWQLRYWQEGRETLRLFLSAPAQSRSSPARARAPGRLSLFEDDRREIYRLLDESIGLCRVLGDKAGLAHSLFLKAATGILINDFSAAKSLLEESLSLYRALGDDWGVAFALLDLGHVALFGEYDSPAARKYLEETIKLDQEIGDRRMMSIALSLQGLIASGEGNLDEAASCYEAGLRLTRELGDKSAANFLLGNLGSLAMERGDHSQAARYLAENLALSRESGDKYRLVDCLSSLGRLAFLSGDPPLAGERYQEALSTASQTGSKYQAAWIQGFMGELARLQGQHAEAGAFFAEALPACSELNDRELLAFLIEQVACLNAVQGRMEPTARLLGAAGSLRAAINVAPSLTRRPELDRNIAFVKAQMDEAAFQAAWEAGEKMTHEDAVAYLTGRLNGPSVQEKS